MCWCGRGFKVVVLCKLWRVFFFAKLVCVGFLMGGERGLKGFLYQLESSNKLLRGRMISIEPMCIFKKKINI
jgi:hypothetical protein